ncbi:unnamed protein product [Mytilus edulis]|uniref:DUF7869 domain-containing protein n=1 Tax=Mytilus edulis TaxID=6550 RepID=A0A8S3U8S3_MYTED|nr:unnamed protein product [Mytilus edulis]
MDTQESLRSTPKGKRASYTKGRSPNELNSRRRQSALDFKSIASELDEHRCGCSLDCYSKFKPADIYYWRMKIHSIPEGNERMEKICQIIRLSAVNLQKHERCQLFHVDQRSVCRKAFISLVLRISIPTFTRAKRRLISKTSTPAKLEKKKTHSWRGKICEGFLRAYIKSACDSDPSKTRYRMPVGISRIRLFNLYRNTHTDDGIAKSAFYVILKQKFPDLSFNATQRFTKCTQCHDLCKMIEEEKDPIILMELEELLDFHHRQQQLEREAYYVRRGMAEMRPDEYVSIILDGMDQNKTDLPHYVKWNNPNGAGALKLRTHVVGSIVHGRGKQYFLDYNQFKHDTNLTLSCLLRILQKEAKEKQLPPTLFVQLDNTCRENKNKYFVGMMAYLVKKKIVKEVWMSFLIVGHTHEDVDQSFSKISHKLRTNDAITLPELHTLIRESQSPLPEIEDTRGVWNISSWLEDYVNQIHNVTFPKLYRIFNDAVGHTTVKFKVFSTDDVWHPSHNERPLEIFKINKGEQALPPGFPALVDQQLDHDFVKDLKRSVERDYKLANFSEERMSWWKIFMDQPIIPPTQQETEWPLNNLNQYRPAASKATLGEKEQELVDKYLTKRNEFKEVYTNQVEVGAARGTHQDRRRYITGKMVVIKLTELNAKVGKVIKQDGDILTVEQFKQDGNKFIPTGEMENYDIFNCFPGSFDLTKSGNLPQNEKVRLDLNGLKI